jgi:EamA domain-containing membrane protein RarD
VPDLSVCVREVGQADLERLLVSEKERRKVFGGTSGVMFVFLDGEEQAKERLEAVLMNRPRIPHVPLAVLTTTELGLTRQMFGLAQYVADGLVESYGVFRVFEDNFDITQLVRLT